MNKAIAEIRGMDSRELGTKLQDLQKEQFGLRFHGSDEQVARSTRFQEIRRTIARILTVLGERQRTGNEAPVPVPAPPPGAGEAKGAKAKAKAKKAEPAEKPAKAKPEKVKAAKAEPKPKAEKAAKADKAESKKAKKS